MMKDAMSMKLSVDLEDKRFGDRSYFVIGSCAWHQLGDKLTNPSSSPLVDRC